MKSIAAVMMLAGAALGFCGAMAAEAPKDSVAVTDHSAFRARTSPGATIPDRVAIKLEIRYVLVSEAKGIISLALDDKGEMDFSTANSAQVTQGKGTVDLKAAVRMFQRDTLNGIVLLRKTAPAPGEKPLAITSISIDLKRLTRR